MRTRSSMRCWRVSSAAMATGASTTNQTLATSTLAWAWGTARRVSQPTDRASLLRC
jgi:hypothetical protein